MLWSAACRNTICRGLTFWSYINKQTLLQLPSQMNSYNEVNVAINFITELPFLYYFLKVKNICLSRQVVMHGFNSCLSCFSGIFGMAQNI